MANAPTQKIRSRRGTELLLILVALAIGAFAYANVGLVKLGEIPTDFFMYCGAMAVIALGLHVFVRKVAPFADPLLIPLVLLLNLIGLCMIYRIDLSSDTDLASKQVMWTAVGVIAACIVLFVVRDHRILRRYSYISMVAALVLALTPLIPGVGKEVYGANIWIQVGPMSLQPAEISKILLAIFFAAYLYENRDRLAIGGPKFLGLHLPRMRDFGPILLVWGASLGVLISQKDLGTSLLFFGLFVAMLYLATERTSWIIIGGGLFIAGAAVVVTKFPHVQNRFNGWLNAMDPEVYDAVGGSGQLVRGLFGMASGGLFGTGWGQGNPAMVPFSYSDFIIPSLGEELGLIGLFAIFACYMLFVERGFRIALSTRDGFGKLLAGGLAFVIAWQCFVVIGGVTRLIPLTGLTTPFLAYGGSSLLANWIIVALLLRISDNARRPVPLPFDAPVVAEDELEEVTFEVPDESESPLERRVPGQSVQYLGEVGATPSADTGLISRRSSRSYAASQTQAPAFSPDDSQTTVVSGSPLADTSNSGVVPLGSTPDSPTGQFTVPQPGPVRRSSALPQKPPAPPLPPAPTDTEKEGDL